MSNLRQAAQRALKAMEDGEYRADMIEFSDALIALRAALAEPEQSQHWSDISMEIGKELNARLKRINELELLIVHQSHALKQVEEMLRLAPNALVVINGALTRARKFKEQQNV